MAIEITAESIRELRRRTSAGVMECKQKLEEAQGDISVAIALIQQAGEAQAEKKSSRVAAEGLVSIKASEDGKIAVMLEVNCETDFVAREQAFVDFVTAATELSLQSKITDRDQLLRLSLGRQTIEQMRQDLVVKMGENIQVRRITLIDSEYHLGTYIHAGRIGAIVELQGGDRFLAKELAMHVVANNPLMVNNEDIVPEGPATQECQLVSAQVQASGKPQVIVDTMIKARVSQFLEGASLLSQAFIKDPAITVAQLLDKVRAKVVQFTRFALGEGIEKQREDFAQTVMNQVKDYS